MGLGAAVWAGLALGLSSGSHCFWSCAAVMGPFLVSTETPPSPRRWSTVGPALRVLGWYNLGRLLAYLAVGLGAAALARWAGLPPWLHAAALLLTALVLALAVLRSGDARHSCWLLHRRPRRGAALLLGLLQGVTPCPPFLAAVGLVLSGASVGSGLALFGALFLATALYTLPLALLEPLRRSRALFVASRVVGGAVALVLLVKAGVMLAGA